MKTINDIMVALDFDTMINIVNNDPEHIRRAKEKAERVKRQRNAEIIKATQRQRDIDRKATLAVLTTAIAFVSQAIATLF